MAAALCVKAASELLVRFFLSILDASGRSEVKVLMRADQEETVTLVLRGVLARRTQGTWLERSPGDSHATVGPMERASRTLGEILSTMNKQQRQDGRRLDTDDPLISWMVRRCCWIRCRY